MLTKMQRLAFWAVLIALFGIPLPSSALIGQPPSLQNAFEYAAAVVMVEVLESSPQESDGEACGNLYVGKIVETFKGDQTPRNITFGRSSGLKVGHTYVLFLTYIKNAEALYASLPDDIRATKSRAQGLRITRCNGIVPGFQYEPYMAFELNVDRFLYIQAFLPQRWPDSIPIYRELPAHYELSRTGLISYLRGLK